jgi:hypothetical protein
LSAAFQENIFFRVGAFGANIVRQIGPGAIDLRWIKSLQVLRLPYQRFSLAKGSAIHVCILGDTTKALESLCGIVGIVLHTYANRNQATPYSCNAPLLANFSPEMLQLMDIAVYLPLPKTESDGCPACPSIEVVAAGVPCITTISGSPYPVTDSRLATLLVDDRPTGEALAEAVRSAIPHTRELAFRIRGAFAWWSQLAVAQWAAFSDPFSSIDTLNTTREVADIPIISYIPWVIRTPPVAQSVLQNKAKLLTVALFTYELAPQPQAVRVL